MRTITTIVILFFSMNTWASKQSKLQNAANGNLKLAAVEITKAKTVGQWIENSPKSTKLFRRTYFSQNIKAKMPTAVYSNDSLIVSVPGAKKMTAILRAEAKGNKVHYYFNNRDITRNKNESMNQWISRLFLKKKKKKRSVLLEILFPYAYADSGGLEWDKMGELGEGQTSYWAALLSSMGTDNFENANFLEKGSSKSIFAALDTSEYARKLEDDPFGLNCSGTTVSFSYPDQLGGKIQVDAVIDQKSTSETSDDLIRLSLQKDNQPVGRFAYGFNSSGDSSSSNFGKTSTIYTNIDGHGPYNADQRDGIGRSLSTMMYRLPQYPNRTVDVSDTNPEEFWIHFKKIQTIADAGFAVCNNLSMHIDSGINGVPPDRGGHTIQNRSGQ